ncbi:hypothetical protein pb186bvf_003875 [Paramecium bursaria]
MKVVNIQEKITDATQYVQEFIQSENLLNPNRLAYFKNSHSIMDQFGIVEQTIHIGDINKNSLQQLCYFINRKKVYQKQFKQTQVTSICDSIYYHNCHQIVVVNNYLIYTVQSQGKLNQRKGPKIIRNFKINKYPMGRAEFLYSIKQSVIVGVKDMDNLIIFLDLKTGKCSNPLQMKLRSQIRPSNSAISPNGQFIFIFPMLYLIDQKNKLHERCYLTVLQPQFSQDSQTMIGQGKNLGLIFVVDLRNQNITSQTFDYDFSPLWACQLFMDFHNSQLIINNFKRIEEEKYQQIQKIYTFEV